MNFEMNSDCKDTDWKDVSYNTKGDYFTLKDSSGMVYTSLYGYIWTKRKSENFTELALEILSENIIYDEII